jgi:hypothetical protein
MSPRRTRNKPPFTRSGLPFLASAKRFWKSFRVSSPHIEEFKAHSLHWRRFNAVLCGRNTRLLELLVTETIRWVAQAGTTLRTTVEMLAVAGSIAMPIIQSARRYINVHTIRTLCSTVC